MAPNPNALSNEVPSHNSLVRLDNLDARAQSRRGAKSLDRLRVGMQRVVLYLLFLTTVSGVARAESFTPISFNGADFKGGANQRYGTAHYDRENVNYVYAQPVGAESVMSLTFRLEAAPSEPGCLFLEAMDDDAPQPCHVRLSLNGLTLQEGPSGFPDAMWQIRRITIPQGALRAGSNVLSVANLEPQGRLGMPPWFMVASCVLAGKDYKVQPPQWPTLTVQLPKERRPLPEPLSDGRSNPGFQVRGIKGWSWKPSQYLAEIPVLARYKMNFLMNCYASMCDIEHHPWGSPECNRWWEPLPDSKKKAYAEVVESCARHGIQYCFSMNPNLTAKRYADPEKPADVEALWQHYQWMQGLGVEWFNLSLDDISEGIDARKQARLVNLIFHRLQNANARARMIFCPTFYWGDGKEREAEPYLRTLATELDRDVFVFWTGDAVIAPRITRRAAESYRRIVNHRLILWDNYPVNDSHPTLHLGPVTGRDPDLCEVIEGYMSNPLCPQNEISRVPLLTCADYAYNPWAYDPSRSIGQAIAHLSKSSDQSEALKELVECYPGMLLFGKGTHFNPVRSRLGRLGLIENDHEAQKNLIRQMEVLLERFQRAFPDQFLDARKTLAADVVWLKAHDR